MSTPVDVLLVDDHPSTREGLSLAIAKQSDLRVSGEAASWESAYRMARELKPQVMVLDLNLPDGNGWSLIDQLKANHALPATLVLSVCDEQVYARRILRAGARGYLMKDEPITHILQAIRDVAQGRIVVSPILSQQIIQEALSDISEGVSGPAVGGVNDLRDRELQIYALLGQGKRNKEIAQSLGVSEKTVATYKVRLLKKLGVDTTPELIECYRRSKLVELAP